jgi:hypothetical protein
MSASSTPYELSSIENPEHIAYAEPEKHVTTTFTVAASIDLALQLNLTERIGHGIAGHVFMGSVDGEPMVRYAVKLAPYDDGKTMLFNEASIYERLKPLQGQRLALVFGYFTSETAHALVMEYLGCETHDMNTLTRSQRSVINSWYLILADSIFQCQLMGRTLPYPRNGGHAWRSASRKYRHTRWLRSAFH